ncbi:hypothetical protein HUU51_01390 [Candidatus Gracilibacteria bacterium]|nr:hypothetical protein [Candidatus Gracilibacteria bacterium]
MSKNHNKLDYSTRDTLANIKLKPNYTFILNKDIDAVGTKKGDFEKGDTFEIISIELKEENDNGTHSVKFKVTNNKGKTREYEMSGGVFMKNFIEQIEQSDIAYKKIEKVQLNVKTTVDEVVKPVKKGLVERVKDKIKGKKKK